MADDFRISELVTLAPGFPRQRSALRLGDYSYQNYFSREGRFHFKATVYTLVLRGHMFWHFRDILKYFEVTAILIVTFLLSCLVSEH